MKFFQWDENVYIEVDEGITQCHFAHSPQDASAIAVAVSDSKALVPSEILEVARDFYWWYWKSDQTISVHKATVTERPKPPSYISTETERITFETLTAEVKAAIEDCETATKAAEEAVEGIGEEWAAEKATIEAEWTEKKSTVDSEWSEKKSAIASEWATDKAAIDSEWAADKSGIDAAWATTKAAAESATKSANDAASASKAQTEADHAVYTADHATASADHTQAASDTSQAAKDHTQASTDHTQATSDHSTASSDHTTATSDHTASEEATAGAEVVDIDMDGSVVIITRRDGTVKRTDTSGAEVTKSYVDTGDQANADALAALGLCVVDGVLCYEYEE